MTGIIEHVTVGNGTVNEFGSTIHATGAGALTAGATAYGATAHWDVEASMIDQSGTENIITVQKFTTTSAYTAGYDFTLGSVVNQGSGDYGTQTRGIVKDWIPGISGSTNNTIKIQLTSGDNFSAGTIEEINNNTGNVSVSYTISGSMSEETNFRNKIKHLALNNVVKLSSGWQFHSDHGYTI